MSVSMSGLEVPLSSVWTWYTTPRYLTSVLKPVITFRIPERIVLRRARLSSRAPCAPGARPEPPPEDAQGGDDGHGEEHPRRPGDLSPRDDAEDDHGGMHLDAVPHDQRRADVVLDPTPSEPERH